MTEKLTIYDPAVALVDDDEIAFFMADALETGDRVFIVKAQSIATRAKNVITRRQQEQPRKSGFPSSRE